MEAARTRGGEVGPWCLKVLEGATTLRTGVAGEKFEKGWKPPETGKITSKEELSAGLSNEN